MRMKVADASEKIQKGIEQYKMHFVLQGKLLVNSCQLLDGNISAMQSEIFLELIHINSFNMV